MAMSRTYVINVGNEKKTIITKQVVMYAPSQAWLGVRENEDGE